MTPKQQAQQQAEEAMDQFIDGTGSGYNGEQYSPRIN